MLIEEISMMRKRLLHTHLMTDYWIRPLGVCHACDVKRQADDK